MKKAVAYLEPFMEAERAKTGASASKGRIVMATVKGDVHDIGKNIVGVVLRCNGYEVIDLGVMVPAEKILDTAVAEDCQLVGLSGLITPSLDQMVHVAREMRRRGLELPLLIGGATTSRQHTAVKIAPEYDAPDVHVNDASRAVGVVASLLDPRAARRGRPQERRRTRRACARCTRASSRSRCSPTPRRAPGASRLEFRRRGPAHAPRSSAAARWTTCPSSPWSAYIDWTFFFSAWELKRPLPEDLRASRVRRARPASSTTRPSSCSRRIIDEKLLVARGVYGFWPAASDGDDLVLFEDDRARRELARFPMLRQQRPRAEGAPTLCLADFVAPLESGLPRRGRRLRGDGRHRRRRARRALRGGPRRLPRDHGQGPRRPARRGLRRVAPPAGAPRSRLRRDEELSQRGPDRREVPRHPARPSATRRAPTTARSAPSSACSGAEEIGMELTESCAMTPAASVSGLYFAHPKARYFNVGPVGRDQVEAYAARRARAAPRGGALARPEPGLRAGGLARGRGTAAGRALRRGRAP